MKRLVSALLPFLFVVNALAQSGNEWIQYSQVYVKIPVGQDGLYRLTFQSLQQAGFPVTRDPRTFQLFHRGKEQGIYIQGETDGVFSSGDFLEFYGQKNDGALDSTLYEDPGYQPHKFYNLFSDTTAYFLTVGSANGKRLTSYSGSSAGLTATPFHSAEKLIVLRDSYSPGIDYGNVQKSTFDIGEGWTGQQILHGREVTYAIEGITDASPASGAPLLEVLLTGRGPMFHHVEISVGSRVLPAVTFSGYESHLLSRQIEWSDIDNSGRLDVKVRVTGANGPDRVSAGYIRLTFPQTTTMGGDAERMFVLAAEESPSLLQIQNAGAGVRVFDVTDSSSPVRISTQLNATLDAVIDRADTPRKILATSQVLTPSAIKRVRFRQINPAQHDYVIVTHPLLRRPALGYTDPVKAFAEYRSLPEGGGYDTLVVNIDQLYDQFNYGEVSPRAIYQFMKFFASVRLPDYLFLIGKGLDINYGYHRNPTAFSNYKDLVPTAGYPASDMLYTTGLNGTGQSHAVATGRLTANTAAEVVAYLNKVKERDALPYTDMNRKKILHLSGGIEESEPLLFRQILESYQAVAEDVFLGGHVKAIAKQSTNVKHVNIATEVNAGVGMITFFGHSAPNTLDFDIGRVSDPVMGYDNPKKYPFMLMNGCDAGSFFLNGSIIGENWIKTPGKGAIGYIAHSSYGLLFSLQLYSETFYHVAFGDSLFIKKGVGRVQQEVARRFVQQYGSIPTYLSQIQQMVLLGDPAVTIFGAPKPDYAPVQDGIAVKSFTDEPVTAISDSFRIEIPVRNYGIARPENIRVHVRREYNAGQLLEYDTIISFVLFEDTLQMTLRNPNRNGYGINVFTIEVDADNLIGEMNEGNNAATLEFFIPSNSTRNVFPYNYSIVSQREQQLSFQFTDHLSGPRNFFLELDTIRSFDSPFLQQFTVNAEVLARKSVTLAEEDSVVYFWRTKIANPLENESQEWAVSSFSYIDDGPEGWAQLHFQQYQDNPALGLVSDPELRRIEFQETVTDIAIRTFASVAGKPLDSISFRINGAEFNLLDEGGACRNNTINLIAFDRRSTKPYAGLYFKWYELLYDYGGRRLLCGREPHAINSFTPQELVTGKNDDLLQYVDNIPAGDTVVLFNIGNAGYSQWPPAARNKLGELGISGAQLDVLQDGDAVVIFGRKGALAGTAEIHHVASNAPLRVERTIEGRFNSGSFLSGLIGPAQNWDRLVTRVSEAEDVDDYSFSVIGVKADGEEDTLRTDIHAGEDLSFINAGTYPHIKVLFAVSDNVNLTATQLRKWMVLYEPFPEGMVIYRHPVAQQVVAEGQTAYADFGFINLSNKSFTDSLIVRFDVVNHTSGRFTSELRMAPPPPGDTTVFTIPVDTRDKGGLNDLEVFANPRIVQEKTYDNNFMALASYLDVGIDQAAPVIEVTFDGRPIQDNEFVSANPKIIVRVWDENPFLHKLDTVGVRIYLASPCDDDECEFEAIHFTNDDIEWFAATHSSEFTVHFSPQDLVSGVYRLRVEAEDASGNSAGAEPYEIRFRVEHNPSVTVTTAYPNPFSLEATLDVIVTGEELSLPYKLYITTVNGSAVREISSAATDGLHVGINRINWDGSDNSNQHVPNGLYFYRLSIRNGEVETTYNGKLVLRR